MTNYVEEGNTLTYAVPTGLTNIAPAGSGLTYGIASGDVVLVGARVYVAKTNGAGTDLILDPKLNVIALATKGVYKIAKATGAVSQGADVYWDNTAKKATTTASGNTYMGTAWLSALSADAILQVRLSEK